LAAAFNFYITDSYFAHCVIKPYNTTEGRSTSSGCFWRRTRLIINVHVSKQPQILLV